MTKTGFAMLVCGLCLWQFLFTPTGIFSEYILKKQTIQSIVIYK